MTGNAIPDIPRLYTALAEWLSCMAVVLMLRPQRKKGRLVLLSAAYLAALVVFMEVTATIVLWLWVPCMLAAFLAMAGFVCLCTKTDFYRSIYYGVLAFTAAECMASLAWQLVNLDGGMAWWTEGLVLATVYGMVMLIEYRLFGRRGGLGRRLQISRGDWFTALFIGIIVFAGSNLRFVTDDIYAPGQYSREIANARTLIDVAGVSVLYAHYVSYHNHAVLRELEAVQATLQTQYQQYMQSRESIELINVKYHDMRHQIQFLRSEEDPGKRNAFLDEMERQIEHFQVQNKTGNPVLDTILTGKSLYCHQHGITMTSVADGKLLDFMEVVDICNIFGNALENAIESVMEIEDKEKRLIHVTVSQVNAFVMIRIENYFEGQLQTDGEQYLTTKSDKRSHGYGIKSIQYTAHHYDGAVSINASDHWFDIKIVIPMKKASGSV